QDPLGQDPPRRPAQAGGRPPRPQCARRARVLRRGLSGLEGRVDVGPQRIVCLTEEPTEVLYLLGEEHRIVGISGFTVRPTRARAEKPRVSAFTSAKVDEILALKPDLAIGFSDMQAEIAQALVRAGVEVWIANHRSVNGILSYVRRLGALVGVSERANALADELSAHITEVRSSAQLFPRRPKV